MPHVCVNLAQRIFYRYDPPRAINGASANSALRANPWWRELPHRLPLHRGGSRRRLTYFTTSEGTILRYNPQTDSVAPVEGEDMRKDYFGCMTRPPPAHGIQLAQTFWRAKDKMIYGVHGNSVISSV